MSPAILDEAEETTAEAEPPTARWVPQSYYDPGFATHVTERLESLRALRAGWDGYKANPVTAEIIAAAVAFIGRLAPDLAPRPRVVPLASGAVQLEWVSGSTALELEFETPLIVHYLKWRADANISEEDSFQIDDIAKAEALIKWFTSQNA